MINGEAHRRSGWATPSVCCPRGALAQSPGVAIAAQPRCEPISHGGWAAAILARARGPAGPAPVNVIARRSFSTMRDAGRRAALLGLLVSLATTPEPLPSCRKKGD